MKTPHQEVCQEITCWTMQAVVQYESSLHRSSCNLNSSNKAWGPLIAQCIFSRLTCLSCLVFLTFIICITQEFTYILNFHGYVATRNWMHGPAVKLFNRKIKKESASFRNQLKYKFLNEEDNDDWLQIMDGVYSYAAYWDTRFPNGSFVRIIAGAKIGNRSLPSLKCLLLDATAGVIEEVEPTHKVLIEHHFRESRTVYIFCNTVKGQPPSMVSLVPLKWNKAWKSELNWMKVHMRKDKPSFTLGVCVRPLFNYTNIFRIVEFIAYYEALGATHFTFYNHDSTEIIWKLIKHLQHVSYSIEFLPWNLPPDIKDMWSLGQIASINDCIYRHMGTNSYIAIVDLDEFITPRHVMNVQELLFAHEKARRRTGSFVFRSCVFCSEYRQDVLPHFIPPFITQTSVRRENWIYPFLVRTKYVVKTSEVVMAGVHHIWELLPGAEERLVPASQVLVHHYRAHLCPGNDKYRGKGEVDPISRKYLNHLLRSKVIEVWKQVMQNTDDEFS
ncbi:hypothetical protein AVEN_270490-1 [Araneus ventricosus]|uniref:Glycosyltransferase family 92 protein n=1 Tax=Araneus ventricosus TaxID=182803 RepID=A0A4Y2B815_ARAVE|nr:hypothetical protein AVEN_270490-1 [Araneus ventricosus]